MGIFESGEILIHSAEMTGQLIGSSPTQRLEILQWLMWQMGKDGPMFGQRGFYHAFTGREIDDNRLHDRQRTETRRLLGALDRYDAMHAVGRDDIAHLENHLDRFLDRPAVHKGLVTPPRD